MTAVTYLMQPSGRLVLLAAVSFAAGNDTLSQVNGNGSAVVWEAVGTLQQSGVLNLEMTTKYSEGSRMSKLRMELSQVMQVVEYGQ